MTDNKMIPEATGSAASETREGVQPVWPVFRFYIAAVLGMLALAVLVFALGLDISPGRLGGLLTAAVASSMVFVLTTLIACRPLSRGALRILHGRQTSVQLAVMVVGTLALSQALDSLSVMLGIESETIRILQEVFAGLTGPDLLLAVVLIGLLSGTAEELFFRGYMQTRLVSRWRPAPAVLVTSLCFGIIGVEPVYAASTFVLGLYLGWLTELADSIVPAIACHVTYNMAVILLGALQTHAAPSPGIGGANPVVFGLSSLIALTSILWLRRKLGATASSHSG